jgi:hypothetical protein
MEEFNPDRAVKVTEGTENAPVNINTPSTDMYSTAKEAQDEIVNKRIQEAQPNFNQTVRTGAMVGAGALATAAGMAMSPAAFVPLAGRAAPYVSALANGAVSAAASLGIDLIGGEYRSPEELLQNAGTAAFIDVASSLAIPPAGKWIAKKLFTTSNKLNSAMALRARDAQELLSSEGSSLPMGQMEGKSGAILGFGQSITDGSMFTEGSAKAARSDRVALLGDIYKGFMNKVGTEAGPVTMGNMLQGVLYGHYENYGTKYIPEGFAKWVGDTKTALFQKSDAYYTGKNFTAPKEAFDELKNALERYKDTDEIGPAYKALMSYMPEAKTIEASKIIDPSTGLPAIPKQTVQPDMALEDLIFAKRDMNEALKKSGKDAGKVKGLAGAVERTNTVIDEAMLTQAGPEALAAYKLANEFHGTALGVQYQKFAEATIKQVAQSPETVLPFLMTPKDMPSKLKQLKNLWDFATEGMNGKVAVAEIPTFEEAVRKPLRYNILVQAFDQGTGAFDEGKAWSIYNRYPREVRQELFGQEADAVWTKVANAGKYLADAKFAEKMVPKMLEGGLLMTMGYQTLSGDQDQAVKAALTLGAFGMVAHGLSAVMTNSKLARSLLNDVAEGPGSGRFLQGLFNLEAVSMNEALKAKRRNQTAFDSYIKYPGKRREQATSAPQAFSGMSNIADSGQPLM